MKRELYYFKKFAGIGDVWNRFSNYWSNEVIPFYWRNPVYTYRDVKRALVPTRSYLPQEKRWETWSEASDRHAYEMNDALNQVVKNVYKDTEDSLPGVKHAIRGVTNWGTAVGSHPISSVSRAQGQWQAIFDKDWKSAAKIAPSTMGNAALGALDVVYPYWTALESFSNPFADEEPPEHARPTRVQNRPSTPKKEVQDFSGIIPGYDNRY